MFSNLRSEFGPLETIEGLYVPLRMEPAILEAHCEYSSFFHHKRVLTHPPWNQRVFRHVLNNLSFFVQQVHVERSTLVSSKQYYLVFFKKSSSQMVSLRHSLVHGENAPPLVALCLQCLDRVHTVFVSLTPTETEGSL